MTVAHRLVTFCLQVLTSAEPSRRRGRSYFHLARAIGNPDPGMARSTRGDDYQDVPRPIAALADRWSRVNVLALATLGIVGPTRMDYPGSMAAVRAVARYVSRILDEG